MLLFSKIVLIWLFLGVITVMWGWRDLHDPQNIEAVERDFDDFSKDTGILKDDCKVIAYLAMLALGFIILPIALYRKFFIKKSK